MNVNASQRQLEAALEHGLIVSCQPVTDGPMDSPSIVAAMACAAMEGGAVGVRIEGVANVAAVRQATEAPIVGIVKRDLADSPVRITPFLQDIDDLIAAGANVVAIDATERQRPVAVGDLLARIHQHGALSMADASTFAEGQAAHDLGATFVGSTLSGYTSEATPDEPDLPLVERWSQAGFKVIAEGRLNTPELAAKALSCGAYAVTVGSALTRLEISASWFVEAMAAQLNKGTA